MKRDFLTFKDMKRDEVFYLVNRAIELKSLTARGECPKPLAGKTLGLIFEKSSTRTRVSFEVGMFHLGGYSIYLNQDMSQLGRGETYADTARVLSRYVHGVVLRTFSHDHLQELAQYATVPVINGLTDLFHPCQVMADLVTLQEHGKDLETMTVSYIGDGNNMAHSWMMAADLLGFHLHVATPKGFEVSDDVRALVKSSKIKFFLDPAQAVEGCDAINTDTWFSMGQNESDEKRQAFAPFQVNQDLLSKAREDALVLHCLPAHRGEEITNDVLDGSQSVVFDQAENRMYAQMAILELLLRPDLRHESEKKLYSEIM